jgi:hypothetical protein
VRLPWPETKLVSRNVRYRPCAGRGGSALLQGAGWRVGLEDCPVLEVVAVLGLVAEPVPSSGPGSAVVEDVAGDFLGERSWCGESDGGGVQICDSVVDESAGQYGSELGERLVVSEFDVGADEGRRTD